MGPDEGGGMGIGGLETAKTSARGLVVAIVGTGALLSGVLAFGNHTSSDEGAGGVGPGGGSRRPRVTAVKADGGHANPTQAAERATPAPTTPAPTTPAPTTPAPTTPAPTTPAPTAPSPTSADHAPLELQESQALPDSAYVASGPADRARTADTEVPTSLVTGPVDTASPVPSATVAGAGEQGVQEVQGAGGPSDDPAGEAVVSEVVSIGFSSGEVVPGPG